MRRKSKRTQGMEEAHPFSGLSRVNPNAAGVDIGAVEIVACVSGDEATQIVKAFGNYTVDLQALGEWLRQYGIRTVAMESTGVYWIPLFEELERQGFECLLISSRSLRRVSGKKSDITDAQWIQTLHSYGLLEGSFRPQGDLVALRTMLRHRSQLLEHRAPHILHMQKALLQMNIQLSQALSDMMGETGRAMIRAIVAGERSPKLLAGFRDPGCKHSEEEIEKALTGTWREEHLFVLKQSLALYDFYTGQIESCDAEVDRMYGLIRPEWEVGELPPIPKKKQNSHSKNAPKNVREIRQHLKRIAGVDVSLVDGFGVSLAQAVIMEVGTDMGKFPSEKHFSSWLGLAPKHEISGGKVLKNKTLKTKNRAGQAFRMAAQSVKQADCPFGMLYRRLRSRLGPAQATVATAHTIARVVYRMLKYKVEYDPLSVNEYQKQYEEQQVKYMRKTCVEPVETKRRSSASNSSLHNEALMKKRRSLERTPALRLITCAIFGVFPDGLSVFIWKSTSDDNLRALLVGRFLRTLCWVRFCCKITSFEKINIINNMPCKSLNSASLLMGAREVYITCNQVSKANSLYPQTD